MKKLKTFNIPWRDLREDNRAFVVEISVSDDGDIYITDIRDDPHLEAWPAGTKK